MYTTYILIRNYQDRFSTITQYCFDKCVSKFKGTELNREEQSCIQSCSDKYVNSWDRCLKRFQEFMLSQQKK